MGDENRVLLEALADNVGVDLLEDEEHAAGTEEAGDGEGEGRRVAGGFRDGGSGGRRGAAPRHRVKGRWERTGFVLVASQLNEVLDWALDARRPNNGVDSTKFTMI